MKDLAKQLEKKDLSIYDGILIEEYEAIDETEEIHEVSYE